MDLLLIQGMSRLQRLPLSEWGSKLFLVQRVARFVIVVLILEDKLPLEISTSGSLGLSVHMDVLFVLLDLWMKL